MKRYIFAMCASALLVACGVNGEPIKPVYTGSQTFGVNSETGTFTKTKFGVCVGSGC